MNFELDFGAAGLLKASLFREDKAGRRLPNGCVACGVRPFFGFGDCHDYRRAHVIKCRVGSGTISSLARMSSVRA